MKILGIDCGYTIADLELDEPLLRCVARVADFTIAAPFWARWTCNGVKRERLSPAGWTTDLASVPAVACPVVPPHKLIKRPALLHDDLYANRPIFDGARITRGEADAVLWAACIAEGMSRAEAGTVYAAVRIGGSGTWHAHDATFAAIDAAPTPGGVFGRSGPVVSQSSDYENGGR